MDWQGILGNAGQQNAIFWGGAAAVALGFTLLLATVVTRLRHRLHFRRPFALPRVAVRQAAAAYHASATNTPAETPPRVENPLSELVLAARALADTEAAPAPSLAILLRRLQLAGDRLEEVARAVCEDEDDLADAGLKDGASEVEYVFKACAP